MSFVPRLSAPGTPRNRAHWSLYLALLTAWFFLTALTAAFSISTDLRNARLSFERYADNLYGEISNITVNNEAVLEGLAAFLSVSGASYDSPRFLHYAQQVRARYPHIYMLELVESVSHDELPGFVAQRKASGQTGFRIGTFTYDTSRTRQPVADKPGYYPIVFMEPMLPVAKDVLGLDMDSVPFMRHALDESNRQGHAVASRFFRMVEGDQAYIMFRPVEPAHGTDTAHPRQLFAAMVIKSQAILPLAIPDFQGLSIKLHPSGIGASQFGGEPVHLDVGSRSALEKWIFPRLSYERKLASKAQPFLLQAEQQLGWSNLDPGLLGSILVAAALSFGILLKFVSAHRRSEALRYQTESQLAYLANHDALTGLANRTLFMDRLAHAMARAHRCNTKLGLLFLDLDKFKPVNDTYGHGVGDHLLKVVAERICSRVREDDTVARLSGDEFVIILESLTVRKNAETVAREIQADLARPYHLDDEIIHISASIGIAVYPDECGSIDDFIKLADNAMYAAKKGPAARSAPAVRAA